MWTFGQAGVCLPGRDASLGKAERTVQGKRCGIRLSRLQGPGKQLENGGRAGGLSEVPDNFFITNPKNSKMLEKLKLELIPRYIIFDKQGNIVEMNAPRPSDKQVTTTIDKYLK